MLLNNLFHKTFVYTVTVDLQYKGDDENIDVDVIEEMEQVDIV